MPLNYFSNLYSLRKNLSLSKIEDMQAHKLQALVKHAYSNVSYYRNLFGKAGIKAEDIKDKNDLLKIPITTRLDLQRASLRDRITKGLNINRCLNLRTSGSTGRPLDIFVTEREHLRSKTLAFLKIYLENGCGFTDTTLRVVTPAYICQKKWFQHLGILREYFVSMFDDTNTQLNAYLKASPDAIRGYTSGIKALALSIKEKGIKIRPPKAIFTTAEVLDQIDRRTISNIFQTKIIDYYCCNEIGIIAFECKERRGYHLHNDNAIVEIIKNDGTHCKPNEEGAVVVTGLNRFTMPFIRYQIGDRAVFRDEKCSCRNNSPLIQEIVGRENDQIILSTGKTICPYLLTGLIKEVEGVREFQIVQKEIDRISINIVKDKDFKDESLIINRVKRECQNALNGKNNIDALIVEEIPKDKTGKAKFIKNEINSFRSYIP